MLAFCLLTEELCYHFTQSNMKDISIDLIMNPLLKIAYTHINQIQMIPKDLKNIFGLKDEKDLNMANNIWKMLDDMANQDPQQYNKFIQKNVKQGFEDAKQKKQQKQKPFKVKIKPGFCINMSANLNEKPLQNALNQKMLITKQPWSEVKKKFSTSIKIVFNIGHSDRIKPSKSKSGGKLIQKYSFKTLADIEFFYYSLQGPVHDKQDINKIYFIMILSTKFYQDMISQPAGKKTLLGICLSYFQERLSLDKNPLLKLYNPQEHKRLAFYAFDKFTIEISDKIYFFAGKTQPQELLLEKEVDLKRQGELQKQKIQSKVRQQKQTKPKLAQIKFKEQRKQQTALPQLKLTQSPPQKKKILIEVLKEQQNEQASNQIAYEMKQTQDGYWFQFLLAGISSIKEVDLQMKIDSVRLRVKDKKQLLISLKKCIKEEEVKAKFKKKQGVLTVQVPFK